MKIPRKLATKIMSAAAADPQACLLGVIDMDTQSVQLVRQDEDVQALMQELPGMPLVYNQHEQAIAFAESVAQADEQYSVEVFQDIEGVFGLRAYRQQGKMRVPVEMELQEIAE